MTMQLGDRVELHGQHGRIVDIDPDDAGNLVVLCPSFRSVRPHQVRLVETASFLRRGVMRVSNFALLARDFGPWLALRGLVTT